MFSLSEFLRPWGCFTVATSRGRDALLFSFQFLTSFSLEFLFVDFVDLVVVVVAVAAVVTVVGVAAAASIEGTLNVADVDVIGAAVVAIEGT